MHEHLEPFGDDGRGPAGPEGGGTGPPVAELGQDQPGAGSRVVTDYLDQAGLTPFLERLGFHLVGYGCTTCIGNSGPLPAPVSRAIAEGRLVVAAVLSGNRNFEGRIHPEVRANYLASPPLVVAYALAGRMDFDFDHESLGQRPPGATRFPPRHLAE